MPHVAPQHVAQVHWTFTAVVLTTQPDWSYVAVRGVGGCLCHFNKGCKYVMLSWEQRKGMIFLNFRCVLCRVLDACLLLKKVRSVICWDWNQGPVHYSYTDFNVRHLVAFLDLHSSETAYMGIVSIIYDNTLFVVVISVDVIACFVDYCDDNILNDPRSNICFAVIAVSCTVFL
jgi:hypothetical protein